MSSDQDLQHDVMAELEWEPSLDAAHIGVAVDDGVVTLSGHVGTYTEKQAAERAARRVKGVRAIAQEIEVRLPHAKKTADDEIAQRAARLIDWNTCIPAGTVQIKVEGGWVTLSGEVEWQYQKDMAANDVEKLSGVRGVSSTITVKPKLTASDIQAKIEDAFRRNADLESRGIKIRTDGGTVTLEGTVWAYYERDMAERAAWSAPGVFRVDDRIRVS